MPLSLTSDFVFQATQHALADYSFVSKLTFSGISTDSRKNQKDYLFVAIEGEKFDANQYIEQVLDSGALGVICKEGAAKKFLKHPRFSKVSFFGYKKDVWEILMPLASHWRKQFDIPIIGITGSVGKTTTKELIAAILDKKWPNQILKTEGSQNGYLGIPLTLLQLNTHHRAAVIEIGIDEIGSMQEHIETVAPNFTLLTAIGPEHLERLIDIQTVAREEGLSLQKTAKTGGFVAINLDDPWIRPFAASIYGKNRYAFSLNGRDIPKEGIENFNAKNFISGKLLNIDTLEVNNYISYNDANQKFILKLPLPGEHNARNLLGALCISKHFEISKEELQKALLEFQNAYGRSELNTLYLDKKSAPVTVLCDYYNANPQSVEAGIKTLCELAGAKNRKIIVLGDMLELGLQEYTYHKNLIECLMDQPIEQAFLYGPRMIAFATEIKKQSSLLALPTQAQHFQSCEELSKALQNFIQPGDFVLIKGSRGMKMEEVWKQLKQNFYSQ